MVMGELARERASVLDGVGGGVSGVGVGLSFAPERLGIGRGVLWAGPIDVLGRGKEAGVVIEKKRIHALEESVDWRGMSRRIEKEKKRRTDCQTWEEE